MPKDSIYKSLAPHYDTIMADIDYEFWSDYLDGIFQEYHPNPIRLLELACGTANILQSLHELDCYNLYGTDLSAEMISIAKNKLAPLDPSFSQRLAAQSMCESDPVFKQMDVVFCVFDSFNYLLSDQAVTSFFNHAHCSLNHRGILVFDFVTSKHCIENAHDFSYDEKSGADFRLVRKAHFPTKDKLHQTHFKWFDGPNSTNLTHEELHYQRPYQLKDIEALIPKACFEILDCFDDFSDSPAQSSSKRITVVARCQKNQ